MEHLYSGHFRTISFEAIVSLTQRCLLYEGKRLVQKVTFSSRSFSDKPTLSSIRLCLLWSSSSSSSRHLASTNFSFINSRMTDKYLTKLAGSVCVCVCIHVCVCECVCVCVEGVYYEITRNDRFKSASKEINIGCRYIHTSLLHQVCQVSVLVQCYIQVC